MTNERNADNISVAMRQRMMKHYKSTEDGWKVIKVQDMTERKQTTTKALRTTKTTMSDTSQMQASMNVCNDVKLVLQSTSKGRNLKT